VITFQTLRNANPAWLGVPTGLWEDVERKLRALEERMTQDVATRLHQAGWLGHAADGAGAEVRALQDKLSTAVWEAAAMVTLLRATREQFVTDQASLVRVVDEAVAQRFDVRYDGTLATTVMADGNPPATEADRIARDNQHLDLEARIRSCVETANQSDRFKTDLLFGLRPGDLAAGGVAARRNALEDLREASHDTVFGPALVPREPVAAAEWWRRLSDEQREMYVNLHPAGIGRTDGLPASVRDKANRIALDQEITALRSAPPPSAPHEMVAREQRWRNLVRIRQTLIDHENGPDARPLMLLAFDGRAQGRVVLSVGNPDTADHVAVYVPGTKAEGGELTGLDRVFTLHDAADRLTPRKAGDVATVLWMDYDAPDTVPLAMSKAYADNAAPRHDAFIDGVRAQNGAGRHITVVGHSYGSVVIGDAARRGDGIAADDIVVAGSPGIHVDSADDLNIDPRHVWAQEARGDAVPELGAPFHGGLRWDGPIPHAVVPTSRDFGANVMTTDGHGHSSYWDEGSVSLNNQARVVMATYTEANPRLHPELESGDQPS